MLLKWIVRNKYKLMALILGGYLLVDIMQHKGLTRVLLPKKFPLPTETELPRPHKRLINRGKEWAKAIDSKESLKNLPDNTAGFETDVYFNLNGNYFDVHHDRSVKTEFYLDSLLQLYQQRKLSASIWLDFKNLGDSNNREAFAELLRLRNKYQLTGKLLVESNRADLLAPFSDSGFYTAYYTSPFNPYTCDNDSIQRRVVAIRSILSQSRVDAITGYYYEYPFLAHYFPNYDVLIWMPNDRWSLVNWLFRRKVMADSAVFITLYP